MLTWNEVPFSGHEFFEAEMLDEKEGGEDCADQD